LSLGSDTHGFCATIYRAFVLQHITVNGYTETDPFAAIGGFTALSLRPDA
jgi:hypothetical protein